MPGGVSESSELRVKSLELKIIGNIIQFNIPEAGLVKLSIYDICGRKVKVINQEFTQGKHSIALTDLRNGVYFARLTVLTQAGNSLYPRTDLCHQETKKMVLVH